MDSITQIILGTAVGEVVCSKYFPKRRAALWGGLAGLIPDLDIVISPFVSEVGQLIYHRTFTHSLLFVFLAPLVFAYLLKGEIKFKYWYRLFFWGFFTHVVLDCLTSFGTAVFWPISDYRVAVGSVFIADLFYTIPFLLILILALKDRRKTKRRRRLAILSLVVSTFYLTFGLYTNFDARTQFENALLASETEYKRLYVSPTPLNIFLWRGLIETENGYATSLYSFFDQSLPEFGSEFKHNKNILPDHLKSDEFQDLVAFSDGYYSITDNENGSYLYYDVRYGLEEFGFPSFMAFNILEDGTITSGFAEGEDPRRKINVSKTISQIWERIKGK
jgi:inner membrane protein